MKREGVSETRERMAETTLQGCSDRDPESSPRRRELCPWDCLPRGTISGGGEAWEKSMICSRRHEKRAQEREERPLKQG